MSRSLLGWLAMLLVSLGVALILVSCGGGWADADTASATDSARAQLMIESACADGGACSPGQVRALERMSYCATASMIARHGGKPPAPGSIVCLPR